jgi:hypothetical protein
VSAYFALLLLNLPFPAVGGSLVYLLYVVSTLPLVGVLLLLAAWGRFMMARARRTGLAENPWHRRFGVIAIVGVVACAGSFALVRVLPRVLPTGSDRMSFDSKQWQDEHSTDYFKGDIAPRQKMLADVVRNVLPGKTREEIEAALGPSLNTPYFQSSRRDMIYVLGFQRDSFFGIDSEWLLIWLDDTGHFERYKIATD